LAKHYYGIYVQVTAMMFVQVLLTNMQAAVKSELNDILRASGVDVEEADSSIRFTRRFL
jgi:UDP-N-acetylglucosamine enolpyruvyl transferase